MTRKKRPGLFLLPIIALGIALLLYRLYNQQSVKEVFAVEDVQFNSTSSKRYVIEGADLSVTYTINNGTATFNWSREGQSRATIVMVFDNGAKSLLVVVQGGQLPESVTHVLLKDTQVSQTFLSAMNTKLP